MPFQRLSRLLSVLASALAAAGLVLAVAGCGHITPLGQNPPPVKLPPTRNLGSPIMMQVMRGQPPTPAGRCPAGSVALFGLDPNVARVAIARSSPAQPAQGIPATPIPTPATAPAGVACYLPVGRPVTITYAAVSPVTTSRNQPGPAWYEFVVAFPTADVAALTSLIRQAYDSGDALGMSVAGKLWQAPLVRRPFPGQHLQITLLSRNQALQLHHILVPSG